MAIIHRCGRMEFMSDDFFPMTVTASPCGHSMTVT